MLADNPKFNVVLARKLDSPSQWN